MIVVASIVVIKNVTIITVAVHLFVVVDVVIVVVVAKKLAFHRLNVLKGMANFARKLKTYTYLGKLKTCGGCE